MKHDPAAPIDPPGPAGPTTAHLVVKRGHRGRYRLTLMIEGVRMNGDLTVTGIERATGAADERALALFARAAAALATSIATARVKP